MSYSHVHEVYTIKIYDNISFFYFIHAFLCCFFKLLFVQSDGAWSNKQEHTWLKKQLFKKICFDSNLKVELSLTGNAHLLRYSGREAICEWQAADKASAQLGANWFITF